MTSTLPDPPCSDLELTELLLLDGPALTVRPWMTETFGPATAIVLAFVLAHQKREGEAANMPLVGMARCTGLAETVCDDSLDQLEHHHLIIRSGDLVTVSARMFAAVKIAALRVRRDAS